MIKVLIKTFQAFLVGIIIASTTYCGFAANTIVHVPSGYKSIQDLRPGDLIIAINAQGKFVITHVSHSTKQENKDHIYLSVDDQKTVVARSQKFFNITKNKWVKAKRLRIGDQVKIAQPPGSGKITSFKEYDSGITLYDIRLKDNHVFCVNSNAVVVHNCGIFVVGVVWTFNFIADIAFEKIVFSIIIPFICASVATMFCDGHATQTQLSLEAGGAKINKTVHHDDQLTSCGSSRAPAYNLPYQTCPTTIDLHAPIYNDASCSGGTRVDNTIPVDSCPTFISSMPLSECNYSSESTIKIEETTTSDSSESTLCLQKSTPRRHIIKESEHEPGKSCNPICEPPPKGPHGYFIPSEKHKSYAVGNASAGPSWEEGQKALDSSVPVLDKNEKELKQRVVVWDKKFVVFEPTGKEVWHGHYRPWDPENPNQQALTHFMKKALVDNGMVNNINSGKIINDKKTK